ncbi:MAG: hypothetical protein E6Q36_08110 [Chryseobacterium sp.]|nr:MAG: hypothetical protein E6Q36_08110 [Chryseobacterium sp.]
MQNISRSLLFYNKKMPVKSILLHDLFSIGRVLLNPDAKVSYRSHELAFDLIQRIREWRYKRIKPDIPTNVFNAIESVLVNRGGETDGIRNFYIKRESCKTTDFSYILELGKLSNVKPEKVQEFETDFEEVLFKIMGNTNVRIAYKPLRIIIDIDAEKTFLLKEHWKTISELEKNKGICVPGFVITDKIELYQLKLLSYVGLSVMARSGFGKTQLLLSLLLTLCRLNSPEYLSLIIVDPKERDFPSLEILPHLACPIIYEYTQALVVLRQVMLELEKRRSQRLPNYKPIVVVFDELADLVDALGKNERQEFELLVKRIGQKGRSFGIFIIGASQRAYEVPEEIRNKLELKIAGRSNNNNDAYAATGISGLDLTKLAVGEFEVHPNNDRLKGFFIADDNSEHYQRIIRKYVNVVKEGWENVEAHFKVLGTIQEVQSQNVETQDEQFITYCKQNSVTSIVKIIEAHKAKYGKGVGTKKAKEFRNLILS